MSKKGVLNLKLNTSGTNEHELFFFGKCCETGDNGVEQNYNNALKLYEAAADLENPDALNNLGWFYLNGLGTDVNVEKASDLFESAAVRNSTIAMINLGNIAENDKKYKTACYWYREAALMGDKKGLFNYANTIYYGKYLEQDYIQAFRYFSYLNDEGYEGTNFYMGLYYDNGYLGDVDYTKAIYYYSLGAKEDDAICYTQLGRLLSLGLGIEKDEKAGFELYQKAAELGDSLAYANIGWCYETGQGTRKSMKKAIEAYTTGAQMDEQNCLEALQRLS